MKSDRRFKRPSLFHFAPPLWAWGCERVPSLSRSPMGTAIRGSCFFGFFARTRRRGVRAGSGPLALSHGDCDSRLLLLLFLRTDSPPGMREGSVPLALSRGAAIRGFCFFCFFEQTRRRGMRAGSDPLALSRGGRDSRLSTSFASPFVSPYSSGMRTVSDWGGTVTAVDSFFGCAESRFAERKSVWVAASGSVTRISRSAERLYTR